MYGDSAHMIKMRLNGIQLQSYIGMAINAIRRSSASHCGLDPVTGQRFVSVFLFYGSDAELIVGIVRRSAHNIEHEQY